MTGSLVAADVVLKGETDPSGAGETVRTSSARFFRSATRAWPPHKIPATIRFVPALEIAAAGKLARHA